MNLISCSYGAAALCLHLSTHHTSVIYNYYGNFSKLVIVRQLQSGKLYEFNFNSTIIALKDIVNWHFFSFIFLMDYQKHITRKWTVYKIAITLFRCTLFISWYHSMQRYLNIVESFSSFTGRSCSKILPGKEKTFYDIITHILHTKLQMSMHIRPL